MGCGPGAPRCPHDMVRARRPKAGLRSPSPAICARRATAGRVPHLRGTRAHPPQPAMGRITSKIRGRVCRLVSILGLVRNGGQWDGHSLALRFSVSRTRIYDDIRLLRRAGFPVQRRARGYYLAPRSLALSEQLTPEELLALLLPLQFFGPASREQEMRLSAASKLADHLPEGMAERLSRLARRSVVVVDLPDCYCSCVAELRRAIVEERRVVITYGAGPSYLRRRSEFDPHGFAMAGGPWFLWGYSVPHRGPRKIRLGRVLAVRRTPLHFTAPEGPFAQRLHPLSVPDL